MIGSCARRRDSNGFSLVEMIVTVVILGVAIVGLVSGLFSIIVARQTRNQSGGWGG